MATFEKLVSNIAEVLGPTSGLDCDEVDHQLLLSLMSEYESDERDWTKYALADSKRLYTRNLVADTNKKSNILVVVWNPGKGSPIHDHANAHCIMKVLKGSLKETLYEAPGASATEAPVAKRTTTYNENEVTYISDKIGLHKIENTSLSNLAISLHLYTPPHAHNMGFNLYDEETGKKVHVKTAPLYSDRGRKLGGDLLAKMGQHRHSPE